MASIRSEIHINTTPKKAWEAIKDVGNVHKRLAPGILTSAHLDGDARIVTFSSGLVVRETFVDINDQERRFVYTASGGTTTHHNASLQVFDSGDNQCRIVWISDFLPNDVAPGIQELVDAGSKVMKQTLESNNTEA